MGGQIYGSRADLIICDDCITLTNAHQWTDQMDWLRQEVASRLGPAGKLLVIGTRVAALGPVPGLRNPEHYSDKHTPWTYLGQPEACWMAPQTIERLDHPVAQVGSTV